MPDSTTTPALNVHHTAPFRVRDLQASVVINGLRHAMDIEVFDADGRKLGPDELLPPHHDYRVHLLHPKQAT